MDPQGLTEVGEGTLDRVSLTCNVDLQRLSKVPPTFLPHARGRCLLIDLALGSQRFVVRWHRGFDTHVSSLSGSGPQS